MQSDSLPLLLSLAHVEVQRGRHRDSLKLARRAVAISASDVAAQRVLVAALLEAGQTREAVVTASNLVASHPGNSDAQFDLALAHLADGDTCAAQDIVDRVAISGSTAVRTDQVAGIIALRDCRWSVAELRFRAQLARNGRDFAAANNLGITLAMQGKVDLAQMMFAMSQSLARRTRSAPVVNANRGVFEGRAWRIAQRFNWMARTRGIAFGLSGGGALAIVAVLSSPWYPLIAFVALATPGLLVRRYLMRRIAGDRRNYRALPVVSGVVVPARSKRGGQPAGSPHPIDVTANG